MKLKAFTKNEIRGWLTNSLQAQGVSADGADRAAREYMTAHPEEMQQYADYCHEEIYVLRLLAAHPGSYLVFDVSVSHIPLMRRPYQLKVFDSAGGLLVEGRCHVLENLLEMQAVVQDGDRYIPLKTHEDFGCFFYYTYRDGRRVPVPVPIPKSKCLHLGF